MANGWPIGPDWFGYPRWTPVFFPPIGFSWRGTDRGKFRGLFRPKEGKVHLGFGFQVREARGNRAGKKMGETPGSAVEACELYAARTPLRVFAVRSSSPTPFTVATRVRAQQGHGATRARPGPFESRNVSRGVGVNSTNKCHDRASRSARAFAPQGESDCDACRRSSSPAESSSSHRIRPRRYDASGCRGGASVREGEGRPHVAEDEIHGIATPEM